MSKVFGLGLHPDESGFGGVPGLLERGSGVLGDVRILGFFQKVGQCLKCRAEGVKAVEVSRVPTGQRSGTD